MRHRDSVGNVGLLAPGSVQWMTAGRGVIHSEMPEQEDGAMEGFQLWLNLPSHSKMREPWYRDIAPGEVPLWQGDGATVKVIAGSSHGVAGAVQREQTEPLYLDVQLAPGARFEQPLPTTHNAFAYVYRGSLAVAGTAVRRGRMAIFANPRPDFSVGATAGCYVHVAHAINNYGIQCGDCNVECCPAQAQQGLRGLRWQTLDRTPPTAAS
jgi:redox-sensitive bicupin YhaK (pirin superfamily)